MEYHGMSKTTIYRRYQSMKERCNNKNNPMYKYYGDRGIKVCDEWQNSFLKFYEWSVESGFKKELQIDRINNDGNYEPSNCRWVTPSENKLKENRRSKENLPAGICRCGNKYRARMYKNKKWNDYGLFDTVEEAVGERKKHYDSWKRYV